MNRVSPAAAASDASPARPGHALVTGASSGIGEAIAREYARRGVPLVLAARRMDRLEKLANELRAQVPVETIAVDLSDPAAPAALVDEIHRRGLKVRILVNNAGYGVAGRYLKNDWPTHAAFLQVMIGAVSELAWRLLPDIRESGNGRIINVSSVAGLVPGADGQTLYAPVKSYMVKLSESLQLENLDRGVNVTALCPGFTWSEFHDVTGTRGMMDRLPKWIWLRADDVARAGIDAVERGQVIVVPGWRYKLLVFVAKHLPDSWMLGLMKRNSRRYRKVD
ncbi:SDR family oxidoreductase [Pseudoxanthomonas sangjuensis]|uniref:SDR family NAD(P)-dependent oxidoreductase n=1 Tax=Pseudoxanthomonas sangjuensis TaxID=1503750 RepID=UPI001390CC11|nr:SDR family oxidoreductase [Pseudoxanthomonas sangjuensis]KAF1715021.1 dehydrogenase [Pseudoxanthomonas sangjuensis]